MQACESSGFDHFSFTIQKGKKALQYGIFPVPRALEEWPAWAKEADRLKASFMLRAMVGPLPYNRMTPEEQAADDAAIRPRMLIPDLDTGDQAALQAFEKVLPWATFGIETSKGHYLAAICVIADKQTYSQFKERMVKFLDSDPGANGPFRSPGSRNWKPKHGGTPVELLHVAYGRGWSAEQIEASGLLAPPVVHSSPRQVVTRHNSQRPGPFPDYLRCVSEAPVKDGKIDYSHADWAWAKMARDWGHSQAEVEAKLWELRSSIDDKPKRHPRYVPSTVQRVYTSA